MGFAMIYFLIGHRGVGKTSSLKSVENSVDLDEEISAEHDIRDYFEQNGEKKFRELEIKTLERVLKEKSPSYVSLGAGFELEKFDFPKGSKFIWIQRKSDLEGRIFLDRPKLEKDKTSVEEFFIRQKVRNEIYKRFSNFTVEFEEGETEDDFIQTLEGREGAVGTHGFYTLIKEEELEFLDANIEIRSDFFSNEEILKILSRSKGTRLVAIREDQNQELLDKVKGLEDILIDVPLELKDKHDLSAFEKSRVIVSEHDYISQDEVKSINQEGHHVKWAPEVESFEELMEFHQSVEGLNVSFLPRSVGEIKGRWNWYRQITFWQNKITFFRYGLNEYLDQPAHYEVKLKPEKTQPLHGAVIGGDVSLSYSPSFHREFVYKNFGGIYVHISLFPDEFTKENLDFMKKLGIRLFSITSPFKKSVGEFLGTGLKLNTLYLGHKNKGADTDAVAVDFLVSKLDDQSALIWGNGAMGQSIFEKLEGGKSKIQSIRSYVPGSLKNRVFDVLIWASGVDCLMHPELETPPNKVFEFKEHSQAREVALKWSVDYESGHEFFKIQALAQQKFWLKSFKEDS